MIKFLTELFTALYLTTLIFISAVFLSSEEPIIMLMGFVILSAVIIKCSKRILYKIKETTIKYTQSLLKKANPDINLKTNTANYIAINPNISLSNIKLNKNTEPAIDYYNTAHQLQSLKLSVINKMIKNTNDYNKEEYLDLYDSIENIITSNTKINQKINQNIKTRSDLIIS
jgi:hypothetical protein